MAAESHVIIAGAGIGGLCLAHGLRRHGIRVTVYERDPDPDARWTGYRLHLTPEANRALHACLPRENYLGLLASASRPIDAFRILDESLTELLVSGEVAESATLVDEDTLIGRRPLRAILARGLEDVVRWGRPVERYRSLPGGRVAVDLADGSVDEGTLLVGADGRSSRVRRQLLPHAEPEQWDTLCVAGTTPLDVARELDLPPSFVDGVGFAIGPEGHNMFFSGHDPSGPSRPDLPPGGLPAEPDGSYVLWSVGAPLDRWPTDPREAADPEELRTLALGALDGWRAGARDLVAAARADTLSPLSFWVAPDVPHWQTLPGVTLLGDAVHCMPPTGGIGASTALQDAAALVDVLALTEEGLARPVPALAAYESAMLARGRAAIEASVSNLQWAQRLDGPVSFRLGKIGLRSASGVDRLLRSLREKVGLGDDA
ncbi:FAD-dependent oxidoreductase [Actinomycetospora termitidis]|uniref:NAD(P)/FAD-dependent oxidoreductase n=1 Tax=Actinomycetospora termitidis TaxID=3053470 RepID=A0ABT7MD62_9PSEU|nr:NAD(P)/FAD-dependent oxidoreductase [Actinomycetospora sp. Odt1-22]MDL5158604.1 NAD(P)/FAD-dependent oxidoreductase [Actinomycetospora sp. Odt1-22]